MIICMNRRYVPASLSLHVTGYAAICPYALPCYITALFKGLFLRPREAFEYGHISEEAGPNCP